MVFGISCYVHFIVGAGVAGVRFQVGQEISLCFTAFNPLCSLPSLLFNG
jgi:hypothetical protein